MAAYFNRSLFRRNISRFWPLTLLSLIIAFFVFLAPELGNRAYGGSPSDFNDVFGLISGYCASAVPLLSGFSAIAVFGFLHNQKASSYISALPISRLGLYITNYLSGLAVILLPQLFIGIFYGLLISVSFPAYLGWLGVLIGAHLLFYSIAVFAAFLTGNPFMQIFLYTLINFIYSLMYLITYFAAEIFVFGYSGNLEFRSVFSPPIAMLHLLYGFYRDGTLLPALLYWLAYMVAAAVFIVLGYILYKKRKIETAGDTIVHQPMKHAVKYVLSFVGGTFLGALLVGILGGFDASPGSILIQIAVASAILGSVCCLFLEMLVRKKVRVWKTVWKAIIVYVIVIAATAVFISLDGTGFERRTPNQADIAAVSVDRWYQMDNALLYGAPGNYDSRSYYVNGRHWALSKNYVELQAAQGTPVLTPEILAEIKQRTESYFESPEAIETALELHRVIISEKSLLSRKNGRINSYTITYKLKDGSVMTREYHLPSYLTEDLQSIKLITDLFNLPEPTAKRVRFLEIPDDMLVTAAAQNRDNNIYYNKVFTSSDEEQKFHDARNALLTPKAIAAEDLPALIDALRLDYRQGSLSDYDLLEITENYDSYLDTRVIIKLCYDESLVPYPFQADELYIDNIGSTLGLLFTVAIDENCVNTMSFLRAVGFQTIMSET